MKLLKQLSISILINVPSQYVPIWLDALCCYDINIEGNDDVINNTILNGEICLWDSILKNQGGGGGGVSGYLLKRGDMAWNCRTCQSDPTCVQCDACFRNSDHKGHDVFFHATSPGGCCDCGDPEVTFFF
jgi:hypothetical protein